MILATKCHFPVAEGRSSQPAAQHVRQQPPPHHAGLRGQPAPARHRLDRPLPGAPARPDAPTSTRRSAPSPTSSTRARSGRSARRPSPPSRSSRPSGSPSAAGRERFRCEQPPYSIFVRCDRARPPPDRASSYGMGVDRVEPAERRLADAASTARTATPPTFTVGRAAREPDALRPDEPATSASSSSSRSCASCRRGRDAATHLALACTLEHPAVTSAIIGPRTMEHLEGSSGADEHRLDAERPRPHRRAVPPGTNVDANRPLLRAPRPGQGSRRRPR